jgi:hypothetical protein
MKGDCGSHADAGVARAHFPAGQWMTGRRAVLDLSARAACRLEVDLLPAQVGYLGGASPCR